MVTRGLVCSTQVAEQQPVGERVGSLTEMCLQTRHTRGHNTQRRFQ